MILDSPEKVCNIINTKLNLLDKPPHTHSYNNFFDWVVESVLKPKKVHVFMFKYSMDFLVFYKNIKKHLILG